jgi:hypothetical protein
MGISSTSSFIRDFSGLWELLKQVQAEPQRGLSDSQLV